MKRRPGSGFSITALTLVLAAWPFLTRAGDEKPAIDPTGTWKVIHTSANTPAQPAKYILKLKLDGGTPTGTMSNISTVNGKSRSHEWSISEAKLEGSKISFTVAHPFEVGSGLVTSRYQGAISDDTIKGTVKIEFSGHTYTKGWEAECLK